MYYKLSSKYLITKDVVESSRVKPGARSEIEVLEKAESLSNLSILLSTREKVQKIAHHNLKRATKA